MVFLGCSGFSAVFLGFSKGFSRAFDVFSFPSFFEGVQWFFLVVWVGEHFLEGFGRWKI